MQNEQINNSINDLENSKIENLKKVVEQIQQLTGSLLEESKVQYNIDLKPGDPNILARQTKANPLTTDPIFQYCTELAEVKSKEFKDQGKITEYLLLRAFIFSRGVANSENMIKQLLGEDTEIIEQARNNILPKEEKIKFDDQLVVYAQKMISYIINKTKVAEIKTSADLATVLGIWSEEHTEKLLPTSVISRLNYFLDNPHFLEEYNLRHSESKS